jgi:hypothetical protein
MGWQKKSVDVCLLQKVMAADIDTPPDRFAKIIPPIIPPV